DLLRGGPQDDVGRLKKMLEFVQEVKEQCREEIEEHESGESGKFYEFELKKKELEHAQRMEALRHGQALPDTGEIAKAQSAIRAAGAIGVLVPLALIGAVVLASVLILNLPDNPTISLFGAVSDLRSALFAVAWGVAGVVCLLTVMGCLRTVRRAQQWSPAPRRVGPARGGPPQEDAAGV